LDRETREGVYESEGEIYNRTSVSSTRLQQKKIRIEVNASDYATEEILSIECEDGK